MAHPSTYEVLFTFGKHKGVSLGYVVDNDPDYLHWMIDKTNFNPLWKSAAKRALANKSVEDMGLPRVKMKKMAEKKNDTSLAGIVLKDSKTAAVRFPFDRNILNRIKAEIDGRKWNPDAKCWEFPIVNIPKVANIFGGIDNIKLSDDALKAYNKEVGRREALDEIRVKIDTDYEVKTKIPLYPFQKVGVEFAMKADGRAMIADAMGLGKTVQSIGFALATNSKTLIVCPKSVTIQWAEEIKKFTGKKSTMWTTKKIEGHGNNQFHIINYDAVRKQFDRLKDINFDLMVCDEATYLKNRRTLRAKSVLGSWKERKKFPGIKTKYVLFLTGTPVLNRPIEAYYLLNFIDPQRFNNFYHFANRYGGWKMEEPKNLLELHDRTKDLVIRRLKKDVLKELPDKQRNDLFVKLSKGEYKEYQDLLDELFQTWKFNGKPTVGTMPKIQNFLSGMKLERTKELIDEFLENDRSILIFSVYIDPLRQLKEHYGDEAELLYGDTSAQERRNIIKRLQNKESRVGCIGLKAGGMGLDGLQHVIDTVVFLNQGWTPAEHEQAEDRTHRIGQKNKVQIFYMICEDTIDVYMKEILDEKLKIVEQIVDGQIISKARGQSYFKEFVKRLSKEHKTDFGI